MKDLEMTKLCAEAMEYQEFELNGWPFKKSRGPGSIDYVEKYDPMHDAARAWS